ncbi:hypothetical protein FOL46_005138, partial [Perkinsus olseni]
TASCAIPPPSGIVILMAAHRRGPLVYVLLALMIPSSILSLASRKKKDAITPDQLEYRLAKPSDVLLGEVVEPEGGVFVAAEKGKGVRASSSSSSSPLAIGPCQRCSAPPT